MKTPDLYCLADHNASGYHEFIHTHWPGLNIAILEIAGGEPCKELSYAHKVWEFLSKNGATRNSTLICLGGGATTDLGGFCASTYKRGMHHVNVPTTLLGAIDAAIGGKTAINFMGMKNQLGTFSMPDEVIIHPPFFKSLPPQELLSGYGEALKTALIAGHPTYNTIIKAGNDIVQNKEIIFNLAESLGNVKKRIVAIDPEEHNLRRVLNMGHTIGHALEAHLATKGTPISHGHAIVAGLTVEHIIAVKAIGLSSTIVTETIQILKQNYPPFIISCADYHSLIALMRHDKKNRNVENISFSLSRGPGEWELGVEIEEDEIKTALDIFRDLAGI